MAKDEKQIKAIRRGAHPYEAHARATMDWKGGELKKENQSLYQLAKARVLGLGYGCGHKRFVEVAKMMAGVELSEHEAERTVKSFRASNPLIIQLWNKLHRELRVSFRDGWHGIPLPSGRALHYRNLERRGGDIYGEMVLGEGGRKLYGGKLCENYIQAIARDVMAEKIIELELEGYRVAYHVHDEVVVEIQEDIASDHLDRIANILEKDLSWYEGLPLGVDAEIVDCYKK
tara:strand:+ start:218 stop:910 length:693 start_codon:yes stop_codon:yes gene_type:complete